MLFDIPNMEVRMQQITCSYSQLSPSMAASIFEDRHRQFVDRLKWDLTVTPDGMETDEYDDKHSTYLIVSDGSRHLSSCRLRSFRTSTMLADHFHDVFPTSSRFLKQQRGRVMELTRFCRAPDISVHQSKGVLDSLAILIDQFRDINNLTGFVAVVFPEVARFLDSIGVRYITMAQSRINNRPAYLICITHCVRVASNIERTFPEAIVGPKTLEGHTSIAA